MYSDPREGLNPKQLEAVETVGGALLIVAGPGSGKTRVITHRIAHLVRNGKVPPYRIGAVTFTNRAAREMRERLFGRSEDDPAAPLLGWDLRGRGLTVSTFHSFCAQVLRQEAETLKLRRDFVIYDDADQMAVVKTAMSEVNADPKKFNPRSVLAAISDAKSRLVGVDAFAAGKGSYWDEIVHRTYERYEQVLHANSALDFDDLLVKVHTLLRDVPEVARGYQERYVHFMVDEFQDTNVAQYAIARQISQLHRNLCVVGDPDQSIYSWRSADIRNLQSFQADFPEAKVVVLEENYRSTQTILDAAGGVIAANEGRVEKKLWTKNTGGTPLVLMDAYDERDEAQLVLREAERLVRQEEHDRGDIAVMYRVNAQSRAFEDACTRYGVPYQLVGGLRFYQRQEVKDVVGYLRLITNPDDDVSFARVVNLPTRGIGQRTMAKLADSARAQGVSMFAAIDGVESGGGLGSLQPRAVRALTSFRDMIAGLRDDHARQDLPTLIDMVLERTGYLKYAAQDEERGEERLENLEELKATSGEFSESDEGGALTALLERISLVSDTDDLEDNRDRITLITLHQAKGLEFRVVFMVGMEEGLLPHIRAIEDGDPKEMEEERRLAYVGVTRAKERLYLSHAARRGFRGGYGPNVPSRFLDDIPEKLIDRTSSAPSTDFGLRWGQMDEATTLRRPAQDPPGVVNGPHPAPKPARPGPTSARSAPKPAEASEALPELTTGDKVRHSRFGEGIVTGTKLSGADVEVTVAFIDEGIKRLLQSFAKLQKVE